MNRPRISAAAGLLAALCALGSPEAWTQEKPVSAYLSGLPFTMPSLEEPVFPVGRYLITDFGARPDGGVLATDAFARAIAACGSAGGGTVVVPRGVWVTGPIRLESNVRMHLEAGALVRFSDRIADFPLIAGFDGKSRKYMVTPPIHAYRARNIAITGPGVIDGAGEAWRYVKREKMTERQWKELVASGGVVTADGKQWWPSREAMEGEKTLKRLESSGRPMSESDYAGVREYLRPDLVRLVQCEGVLIDGPTFRNSPKFHVHLVQSERIIVRNATIMTPWWAQNGDGLDISSCRTVLVANVRLDVGDDAICLKPGRIASSQRPGPACENIVIADCIVYHGHGGFVIGSESYGGVNNVSVRNCIFIGTDVGLRFKSMRGNGGPVENVFIEGVRMRSIAGPAILFDMFYGQDAEAEERAIRPVTDLTPRFQKMTIRDLVCDGAREGIRMRGLPEMPVRDIRLEDLTITSTAGIVMEDVEEIMLRSVDLRPAKGPAVRLSAARDVTLEAIRYADRVPTFLRLEGKDSRGIRIARTDSSRAEAFVVTGGEVPADAVTVTDHP